LLENLDQEECLSEPVGPRPLDSGTPTPASFGLPFPVSAIDALVAPFRHRLLPLDLDRAMDLAERAAGLQDYGGGGFVERLEETYETLRRMEYSSFGHFGIRISTHWHLVNRLRLVELAKRRPDIQDIDIERPLIIIGLFRTGTTYLHNVLGADPNSRVARMWELAWPVGRKHDLMGDEKRRRRVARAMFAINHVAIPDQSVAHHVTSEGYEEDFFLLENAGAIFKFAVGFANFEYADRMLGWDMSEPYQFHKFQLQALSGQRACKRWLLKCPWHLWNLDALMAVYPDARIIQTHRDVAKAIGSHCSLTGRIAAKLRREMTMEELGRFWEDYSRIGVERGMKARARIPKSQIYDVRLEDLHADPLGVIQDLYAYFDLGYDARLTELFRGRIEEEPTAQHGEHEYDIEDFGLSKEQVREDFGRYASRFGV
jgi:hypothetical protein